MTNPTTTPMTPQEKAEDLATTVEAKFGSLPAFYGWLDIALLTMQRTQLENEINSTRDQQQSSRQNLEVGIQSKQADFDNQIKQLRQAQQTDFDQWQAQIDAKQTQLDALNAQLKGAN